MTDSFAQLREQWLARPIDASPGLGAPASFVDETASTNDDAKDAAARGAVHGALFVAGSQTAGRGRQGRHWDGDERASLLFSLVVRVPVVHRFVGAIPVAAGLALAEAIDALAPQACATVKWPNDVRVRGRKVAGILAEATVRAGVVDSIVVGVGVNVGKMQFASDFADRATSLENEGIHVAKFAILEAFLTRFDALVSRVAVHGLRDVEARIRARHELFGQRIVRSDGVDAIADVIDDEGRLVVRRDEAVERWSSGEVHLAAPGAAS